MLESYKLDKTEGLTTVSHQVAEAEAILLVVEKPGPNQVLTSRTITVEGFAVSPAEIEEIFVNLGDLVLPAQYGIYRKDLEERFPDHPFMARSGFACEISFERIARNLETLAREGLPFSVTARDRLGRERKIDTRLQLSAPKRLERSPPTKQAESNESEMLFEIDEKAVDKLGLLRIKGWAVAKSPIESVSILLGSQQLGVAELLLERPDVAQAWPKFESAGRSGFLFVTDARHLFPDGAQRESLQLIKVIAKAANGAVREQSFTVQAPDYVARRRARDINEFYCDKAVLTSGGMLTLEGWAAASAGIDKIRISFESNVIGFAEYGHERPDVGNKFPTVPQSRKAGFRFRGNVDPAKLKQDNTIAAELILFDGSVHHRAIAIAVSEGPADTAVATAAGGIILNIDEPAIVDGKASRLVEGALSINGWALAPAGVETITFELAGRNVGSAYYGIRREDVANAFPAYGRDNALLSGFAFSLPHRFLIEGRHQVTVKLKAKSDAQQSVCFEIDVGVTEEQPGPWTLRRRIPAAELLFMEQLIERLNWQPVFSVLVHCRRDNVGALSQTLQSIVGQTYRSWTVVIAGGAKLSRDAERIVRQQFSSFSQNIAVFPDTTTAKQLADQARPRDLVLPLDSGDVLAADALYEFAVALNQNERIEFIYADERRFNLGSGREDAFFKPDWSPTLALASNYVGRPWCATVAQFRNVGREPVRAGGSNFETVLQLTETAGKISHVPRVLARRGEGNLETREIETRAVKGALKRRRLSWTVEEGAIPNTYRCRAKDKVDDLVSIIIPTCAARGLVKTCVDSIRNVSTYKHIEIICIENIVDDASEWKHWLRDNCDVVVEIKDPFNWSLFNNVAAREASGAYLLFLNDDIEITQPDWLEAMLDQAQLDDVGVVGPQLVYPDGKVQHAGMFLASGGIGRHAFRFCPKDDPGYFGLALTQRDVIAVTGACMLMKSRTFQSLGGFDESHSVTNNDLDFCLRIHKQKLRSVYTPFASLIHHELASRKDLKDEYDASAFARQWASLTGLGDPFFHPALDRNSDVYQADPEPAEIIFAGHPLFNKHAVKRILAVKLDHIGDFITAFPAFRRIKEHFPNAELTALVGPASKNLAKLEPAIDRVIVFEFFHARSQLGQVELSKEVLAELQHQLVGHEFDIAIDLRKQDDTRSLLKSTGAKMLAGFDQRSEFSWLDLSLTFEGDNQLVRKRKHVSDDLVSLVDMVAANGIADRDGIRPPSDLASRQIGIVSRLKEFGTYRRRVVCIHPASGNEMRRWPAERFGEIANALIATEDIDVALIGGPDEADFAADVQRHIQNSERVHNLVGKFKLEELPYFLDTCALFIGNNSGPKHIAAGIGVPTIGVHSGVVDAREWGPLGPSAVAVQRNMSCSPCYLTTRDQCHRNIACVKELTATQILATCRKFLRLERGIQIT